jgi:hypothetical protein
MEVVVVDEAHLYVTSPDSLDDGDVVCVSPWVVSLDALEPAPGGVIPL